MENPRGKKFALRLELGVPEVSVALVFALTVFYCDGFLDFREDRHLLQEPQAQRTRQFLSIVRFLPLELQMVVSNYTLGLTKHVVLSRDADLAFREILQRFYKIPEQE